MKPFVTKRVKHKMSNTEALKYSWNFRRKSISKYTKDTRRARRRKDKQELNNYE